MADNYLERRMEDLKNGKTFRQTSRLHNQRKRAGLHFSFPPRRVLIVTEDPRYLSIARMFLKADCKVALMTCIENMGEDLAKKEGIRYYHLTCNHQISGEIDKENDINSFDNLMGAWRDIDILISDSQYAGELLKKWKTHRERFPYVSDYKSRIIILINSGYDHTDLPTDPHFSINYIKLDKADKEITGLIGMLVLPSNEFINQMTFEV